MSNTINPREIAHFTKDAPDWWNEDGKFKPLHALNPTRLEFITGQIAAHFKIKPTKSLPLSGLDILDVGCGGGLTSEPLARLGGNITGLDADPIAIDVARDHAAQSGLKISYRNEPVENLARRKDRFDAVLALEIIEHVDNVELFVKSLRHVLKPGGVLILSTLNRTIKSYAQAIVIAEDILGWVTPGTHDWNKFIMPSELAEILNRNNLKIRAQNGISFNPIGRNWKLSGDLGVNYIVSATP